MNVRDLITRLESPVCRCGNAKAQGVTECDACYYKHSVEAKRVREWQRESCAKLDQWEEA